MSMLLDSSKADIADRLFPTTQSCARISAFELSQRPIMSLFYKNLKERFFSSSHTPTNQPGSIPITHRGLQTSLDCPPLPQDDTDARLGKSISHEEVFKYTHGRFLVDEDFQRQRRYVEFSLPELCKVASSMGKSESPVAAIEKMEGGFCKALLITRQDGMEFIAKIPCPIAGPAGYTTASEVAVLQYSKYSNSLRSSLNPTFSSRQIHVLTGAKGVGLGF